jgi:hypothetical protein
VYGANSSYPPLGILYLQSMLTETIDEVSLNILNLAIIVSRGELISFSDITS